jgi:hypothetical protein
VLFGFVHPAREREGSPSIDAARFESRACFLKTPELGLVNAGGCWMLGWYRAQVLEEGGGGMHLGSTCGPKGIVCVHKV